MKIRFPTSLSRCSRTSTHCRGTTSSAGIASQFYFEIKTSGGEQLKNLTSTLSQLGIRSIDIGALYERENAEIMSDATSNLSVFFVVLALLLIVWFFIEKSGSIRNSKEYGIYRAIGVNRSNLLFKEMLTALTSNMIGYLVFYLIVFALMCVRYAVMNTAFGLFVGIALGVMAAGGLLMLAISLTRICSCCGRRPRRYCPVTIYDGLYNIRKQPETVIRKKIYFIKGVVFMAKSGTGF